MLRLSERCLVRLVHTHGRSPDADGAQTAMLGGRHVLYKRRLWLRRAVCDNLQSFFTCYIYICVGLQTRSLISRHRPPPLTNGCSGKAVWVRVPGCSRVHLHLTSLRHYFDTSGSDFSVSSTCVIRKIAGLYIQVVTTSLVPTV